MAWPGQPPDASAWPEPARPLPLPMTGELQVWAWQRADLRCMNLARPEWLSSEERLGLQGLAAGRRDDVLRQRCAVRAVLAAYLDCPEASIELVRGRHGKPALAGCHRLEFSLSHSGEGVLLAVSGAGPVGVDLQCIPRRPHDDLALRMLGPLAASQYLQRGPAARCLAFAWAWAEREALVKAWGLGVGEGWAPCQRLFADLPLWGGDEGARRVGGWILSGLPVGAGQVAVACTRERFSRLRCCLLPTGLERRAAYRLMPKGQAARSD